MGRSRRCSWQPQCETFSRLSATLVLPFALRNADCHSKNLALLHTSWADGHRSPAYDCHQRLNAWTNSFLRKHKGTPLRDGVLLLPLIGHNYFYLDGHDSQIGH